MSINERVKKTHVFTWKIENFSMCSKKKGEKFLSPTFKAKCFDETSWCLELYFRGEVKSDDDSIALFLRRKEDDTVLSAIECLFSLEILDKKGHTIQCNKGTTKFEKGIRWGWYDFIKKDVLEKTVLFEDNLLLRCRLFGNFPEKNFSSCNTGTTKFKISKHSFPWVIKNLSSITRQEVIKLPCSGTSQMEITLQIPENEVKIGILTGANSSCSQFILCNFKLLDVEGKERDSKQASHLFEEAETWIFPTFIRKSQLTAERDLYIKDGCFTLQCDIAASDGSVVEEIKEKRDPTLADEPITFGIDSFAVLKEDFKRLYVEKIHTDLKLKAGNEVFPAHKNILCARSPVFLAMFDNDMAESQKGEVDIPDMDAKTVDLFLEYIYTGSVYDLDYENAMKLIVAAEKYQVLSLKNKCAELLASILCDTNVCEILVTADLVQHDALKTFAFHYIKKQPKKIFNSDKWKLFVKNHFELATETVCEVSTFWGDPAK